MKPLQLLSTDVSERLDALNERTIPRSVKFLKACLENWLADDNIEISPPELYNLCLKRAGDNGHNAFMRATVLMLESQKELPSKFRNMLIANHKLPWIADLTVIIRRRFPKADI